ncbi:restriction endonuclease subunit S [Pseudomonas aeruginosa]|uniref:restriction endonuclease subunit S n=1 Tax=Pseudomonas aeruginosa group TaxID=136841 RepID=UPI0009A79C2B|nr:restriction endonuclease subunit S [Pseudomonas aeruginosa]MBG5757271.1 restriction endonuclease subunit S [Pseudomonas aeruginosa]VTS65879.1 DNA specificity domain-containing restriction modification system protein [Streptococcus dysgalactiae subsp. equisimilis]
MSSDLQSTKLESLITFSNGRSSPDRSDDRAFPVFGSNGLIGWAQETNSPANSIVIGRVGSYCGSVHFSPSPCWVTDNAIRATAKGDNDPSFLYYLLKQLDLNNWRSGSGQPLINQSTLNSIEVTVPGPSSQKLIGGFVSSLDDRITLLRETNATLEAIAQALFKSWFVDFDPVRAKAEGRQPEGMDATTAALFPDSFEESELGLVPKGWSVMPIGEAVECVGGGTPDTKNEAYWQPEEFSWSSPKDLSGLQSPVLLSTERKLSAQGLTKVSSGLLPSGTLLMSSRAPIGYLAIAQTALAVNQGYIAMLPGGRLPPLYLLFWCRENMEIIKGRANGSTFMEISKKAFRPIPASVPPADVLEAFEQIAGSLFERLVANERQAQTLTQLRDTLLPRLISGQLRLPEAQAVLNDMDIAQ